MWSDELEHPEELEKNITIADLSDDMLSHLRREPDKIDEFLSSTKGNLKSLAATALKHIQYALTHRSPSMYRLGCSIHTVTILSKRHDPICHLLQAQHCMALVTKVLYTLTLEPPVTLSSTEDIVGSQSNSEKAYPILCALKDILTGIAVTDGVTWIIEALDAKFLFALIRCELWLPYLNEQDDLEVCLYPFLKTALPTYSVYRSCLLVMDKYLTKIQDLGLDTGARASEVVSPFWKAWNEFTALVEFRKSILISTPGGLIQNPRDRCHNATVSLLCSNTNPPQPGLSFIFWFTVSSEECSD